MIYYFVVGFLHIVFGLLFVGSVVTIAEGAKWVAINYPCFTLVIILIAIIVLFSTYIGWMLNSMQPTFITNFLNHHIWIPK
jgi:hypothetical protein